MYISDALGSVRAFYHASTSVFSVGTYKPFGTPYSASGSEKVRYAQEMQDASSTGLYCIFARYMDSELGRFISLDPKFGSAESPQGMNRYVYCVDNPLRFKDPTGCQIALWFALAGAVWGAGEYVYHWYKSDEPFDLGKYLKYQGVYAIKAVLIWESIEHPVPIVGLSSAMNKYGLKPLDEWMKEDSPDSMPAGPTYSQVLQTYEDMKQYISAVGDPFGPDTLWDDIGQTFNQVVDFFSLSDDEAYREHWKWLEEEAFAKALFQRMYPDRVPFEEWISGVPSGGGGRVPMLI